MCGSGRGIVAEMSRERGINFRAEIDPNHRCHIFAEVPSVVGSVVSWFCM